MKDILKKLLKGAFGTSLLSFVARLIIAGLSFASGTVTDAGDALGQALDKDRSIAAAVELINETPKAEIKKAIVEVKAKETE